jgi:uncharacterized small protein (DUF1192 family)
VRCRVIEQGSKSSAEAFIESVQRSLDDADEAAAAGESVVAGSIRELQARVASLEQEVRRCACQCATHTASWTAGMAPGSSHWCRRMRMEGCGEQPGPLAAHTRHDGARATR